MRKSIMLGTIMALGFAGAAMADDGLNYTYVEGSWVDGDAGSFDGFQVEGSIGFADMFHAFANYADVDNSDESIDATVMEAGVGMHHSLSSNVDLVSSLSWVDVDNSDAGGYDDSGIAVRGGLRGRIGSNFELEGGIAYIDMTDLESDLGYTIDGRYFVTPEFSVGAGAYINGGFGSGFGGGSGDVLAVNFRYTFN